MTEKTVLYCERMNAMGCGFDSIGVMDAEGYAALGPAFILCLAPPRKYIAKGARAEAKAHETKRHPPALRCQASLQGPHKGGMET